MAHILVLLVGRSPDGSRGLYQCRRLPKRERGYAGRKLYGRHALVSVRPGDAESGLRWHDDVDFDELRMHKKSLDMPGVRFVP